MALFTALQLHITGLTLAVAALPADTLIAIEIFAFNFVEIKRWQDFKKPGSQAEEGSFVGLEGFFKGTGQNGYPGGIFDPLGLSK